MLARRDEPLPVGPFQIVRDDEELTLRRENQGELSVKGCFLFAFTMLFVLIVGILSVLQTAETSGGVTLDDANILFAPTRNHFGFLWLVALALLFVVLPLYVARIYNAALVFTFRRADDLFLRNGRKVSTLRRIEYVCLRETRDPDSAYLYLLSIFHGDGQEIELYNGYDERAIMNVANEIAAFVGTRVVWK